MAIWLVSRHFSWEWGFAYCGPECGENRKMCIRDSSYPVSGVWQSTPGNWPTGVTYVLFFCLHRRSKQRLTSAFLVRGIQSVVFKLERTRIYRYEKAQHQLSHRWTLATLPSGANANAEVCHVEHPVSNEDHLLWRNPDPVSTCWYVTRLQREVTAVSYTHLDVYKRQVLL